MLGPVEQVSPKIDPPGADGKYDTGLMHRQINQLNDVGSKISINLNSDFIPPGMSNGDLLKQLAKKHLRERSYYER